MIFPNFTELQFPEKLQNIEEISLDQLMQRLQALNPVKVKTTGWPSWTFWIIGFVILLIVIVGLLYYKRNQIKIFWLAKRGGKGKEKSRSLMLDYSAVAQSSGVVSTDQESNLTSMKQESSEENTAVRNIQKTIDIMKT